MKAAQIPQKYDAAIIGGGAAGLLCAAELIKAGKSVLICEPNRFLGRKLRITGKGRCNLTNNCSPEEVMKNVKRNPKFLFSALNRFTPEEIMKWFENAGVKLKTERGSRVFPESDSAADVAEALVKMCGGAEVIREKAAEIILSGNSAAGIKTSSGKIFEARNVLLAAGGRSYPRTGSDGGGYLLAERAGHTVVKQQPSLVPFRAEELCPGFEGVALKNVALSLYDMSKPQKPLMKELGEVTIENGKISGSLALTASCLVDEEKFSCKGYKLVIDFKPALTEEQLDARLLREIPKLCSKPVGELLNKLLPSAVSGIFERRLNLGISDICGNLTREKRQEIIRLLKRFEIAPLGLCGFDEAIITRGGVSVKEIDPSTMESKLVKGLYFAGEIIDCDGFTGGFNLTIAFATAYTAAAAIINNYLYKKEE